MTNSHMVADNEPSHVENDVQVTYSHVIRYRAFSRIDQTTTQGNAFTDAITEANPIDGDFQKGRKQSDYS
jgi:hypothetical protein